MRAHAGLAHLAAVALLLAAAGCARSPAPPTPDTSHPASEPEPAGDQAARSPAPMAPASEPEAAERHVGRIVEVRGDLKIKKQGSARWERVDRLQRLEPGDRIRVDSGSARIETADGETITLREGSLIQVQGHEARPSDDVQRGLLEYDRRG